MRRALLFFALALVAPGCKRSPPKPATPPAVGDSKRPPWAPQNAVGAPPTPRASLPPGVPRDTGPGALSLDCDRLFSPAKVAALVGSPVVLVVPGTPGASACRWAASGADANGAFLDVTVSCQAGAVRLFRNTRQRIAAGQKQVSVGHLAVLFEEKDRGTVQFVDEKSPCAAEVTTRPAAKALAAAQAVAANLSSVTARR